MGAARAHRTDVGHGEAQGQPQQRYVELGVVGEDAQDRTGVDVRTLQVLVGPLDDDLVGLGEAGPRGEHGARVAHRDVVAEELADPHQRRREVDRAEDDHPGRRHRGLDQERERGSAARALFADLQGAGAAAVQEGARLGGHRAVEFRVCAEAALVRAVGAHQHRAAPQLRGAGDDPCERRRLPHRRGGHGGRDHRADGGARPHRHDQDVDDAAAGQTDGEGVVIAVAEALQDGLAVLEGLLAQLVDRPLHTTAGDRADRRAVRVHRKGRARPAGCAAADRHHGGHGEVTALLDPPVQLFGDVQHLSVSLTAVV